MLNLFRQIIFFLPLCFFSHVILAEENTSMSNSSIASLSNHYSFDLSPIHLYQNAHPVVQAVIMILVLSSMITWAILILKLFQLLFARYKIHHQVNFLSGKQTLSLLEDDTKLGKNLFLFHLLTEIRQEISDSQQYIDDGLKLRIYSRLERQVQHHIHQIRYGVSLLATIGSVAPFIGLFGTVWGIMHSFMGIAQTHNTDLFAVAPGIAEALFATALGLVAAIPAVVIYNSLLRAIKNYAYQLEQITSIVKLIIERDISLNRLVN